MLVPTGKEVDAIYGDMVLQNDQLRAVIAKPISSRNANMTVRQVGGCLIDLVARHHESDALSAFYPGGRNSVFSEWLAAAVQPDGSAVLTVTEPGTASRMQHSVEWKLSAQSGYLVATSTWKNTTPENVTLVPTDDLRQDGGKEDMQKSAEGLQDLFWFHDVHWQQAYGIAADGFRAQVKTNARESTLTWQRQDGQPIVLKPGEEFSLARRVFVARDFAGVLAEFEAASGRGGNLQPRLLAVTAQGKPVAGARIRLSCAGNSRGTVVTDSDGRAAVRLPTGDLSVEVAVAGQMFPAVVSDGRINDQSATLIALDGYQPGLVSLKVVDGDQQPIPAKLEFIGRSGTPTPNWGPETADYFVKNLAYTANGQVQLPLQSGEYDMIVSHGSEFHAEFTTLKVDAGKTTERTISLPRLVQTPGLDQCRFSQSQFTFRRQHQQPAGASSQSGCRAHRICTLHGTQPSEQL
jgi:hypothetical protein